LILLVVGIMYWGPSVNSGSVSGEDLLAGAAQNENEQTLYKIKLYESNIKEKNWSLVADEARASQNWLLWKLQNVDVNFVSQNESTMEVKGGAAIVDHKNNQLKILENVVAKTASGYKLVTEFIRYTSDNKTLIAPKIVSIKNTKDNSLSLTGGSMEASMENSTVKILGRVMATTVSNTGETIKLSSKSGEIYTNKKTIKLKDQVVIEYMDKKITGPEAVIEYDENQPELVSRLLINGGAKVFDFEKEAQSENLDINFKEKKFTFKGSPQLKQGGDTIAGDEIVFLNNGKKVIINNLDANVNKESLEGLE